MVSPDVSFPGGETVYAMPVCVLVLDASAKPPTGILKGAITWPGSMFQCQDIGTVFPHNASGSEGLTSQYCTVAIANASTYHPAQPDQMGVFIH